MSILETEAKQKHCWRINGKCLGAGCMSWKTSARALEEVVPWPESIEKPKLPSLRGGTEEERRAAGAEVKRLCCDALGVLVGTRRGDQKVVHAVPVDIEQKEIRVLLRDARHGRCMEIAE